MRNMHLIGVRRAINNEYAERPGKRRDEKVFVSIPGAPGDRASVSDGLGEAWVSNESDEAIRKEIEEPDEGGNVYDPAYG